MVTDGPASSPRAPAKCSRYMAVEKIRPGRPWRVRAYVCVGALVCLGDVRVPVCFRGWVHK